MTYTFKLSRRLAILQVGFLGALALSACNQDQDLSSVIGPTMDSARSNRISRVQITPDTITIELTQRVTFTGYGLTSRGDSVPVNLAWSAAGGTIDTAGIYTPGRIGRFTVVGSTSGKRSDLRDTAVVIVVAPPSNLVGVMISPDTTVLGEGQTRDFSAKGRLSDSSTVAIGVTWSATGGTIDPSGSYKAGTSPGRYRVIGKSLNGALADTSTVVIPAPATPTLDRILLTPASATVAAGQTTQFAAYGRMSSGDSVAVDVTFTATGGSITATGAYTAGQTAGAFRVVAGQADGSLADTAAVTVTVPVPSSTCTSSGTMLCPGDNLQSKANTAGSGATLTLQPGVYRLQTVAPLSGQTFAGQPGSVLSGARLLTDWIQSGSTWYVTGQTQELTHSVGVCESGTACQYPEDVYQDDVPLKRVLSLASVVSGAFYFDYAADRIYVGSDPTGHRVEAAAVGWAFTGSASNVTIRGLVVEKYANPAQDGAIGKGGAGSGWTIRDNEIRYNHGGGVRGGNGMVVAHNKIHHNAQIGVIGGGFARVDSNEIAFNNTGRFRSDWEAGGTKMLWTTNMVVRGNWSHDNHGVGLWTDTDNTGTVFDGNTVERNDWMGIHHEVSYSGRIINNVIRDNGLANPNSAEGGGIMVTCSGGTGLEISGNTLSGNKNSIMLLQADRGSGNQGAYVTRNVSVHDNTVTLAGSQRIGAHRYGGDTGLWSSNNNHFERNTYFLSNAASAPFVWSQGLIGESQWRAAGNDDTGAFNR